MSASGPPPPPPTGGPAPPTGSPPRSGGAPPPPGAVVHHDHEPTVVEVDLVSIGEREVIVRLADGREGVIARGDYEGAALPPLSPGERLRAAVLQREDPRNRVAMSAAWASRSEAWDRIEQARRDGTALRGVVGRTVKGGLVVDLGVRAFLPRSLVGDVQGPMDELVGTTVEVLVREAERSADRVVVSRREAQRRLHRAAEKQAWVTMAPGQRHDGVVVEVVDYGAKVRVGALQGLVHRSELSWSHIGDPSEVVSVGDVITVEVLEVVRSRRRLSLSLRRTLEHPHDRVEVGRTYRATVVRVLDYGAFARLEDSGAEGLVHVSELSELPGQRADQLVVPGEELMVRVLSTDRERNRMALSAVQAAHPGGDPA